MTASNDAVSRIRTARSTLFVPATRPDRIAKALTSEADLVIVDLEDAVAPEDKAAAREALEQCLDEMPQASLCVRINAPGSEHFDADLDLCARLAGVTALMVSKAEFATPLKQAAALGRPLWPLIESAAGLDWINELAAVEGVERLSFGALDLALDLALESGTPGAEAILDQARYQLVLHSRLAGLAPPMAGVSPVLDDDALLHDMALRARQMGFGGMLCIHPCQLGPVHRVFTPDAEQLAWAQKIVTAAQTQGGAFRVDGEMVDAPVIERARRLLARADRPSRGTGA
ncbi:citrate lyase subunit beta / citryl-CoA lyase/(S)-citramalyl-CoA lyase [Kushneria avicenniae]|uniref:Citrate lyase subunit beta / citryl-CoA lyase/(S)-citramalyl-CoA lyase n=1 Tax=Kushneria avicenniae TaxID=402385 RepID=A0A1I1LJZ3_9GAMM|nr:CoA ester lyase [Kushneria avicenniae]SFC73434.1 citrate lyase subunit beta / citryl-CoA lyase/(S)-citramalyl-CoA lyase [Kushneria avicenniae]